MLRGSSDGGDEQEYEDQVIIDEEVELFEEDKMEMLIDQKHKKMAINNRPFSAAPVR